MTYTPSDLYANLGTTEDSLTAARRALAELERSYHRLDTPAGDLLAETLTALVRAREALDAAGRQVNEARTPASLLSLYPTPSHAC